MDDCFKNSRKIGTGNHVMQIVIDYAFYLAELPELLIILFRLGNFKFHKFMYIVAVSSPFRTAYHQFECIEIVINVIDKICLLYTSDAADE